MAAEPVVGLEERHVRGPRAATWAAISPATPEPMTATVGAVLGHQALLEREGRRRPAGRLLRAAVGLDGDADADRVGRVALEEDLWSAVARHQAGGHHPAVLVVSQSS